MSTSAVFRRGEFLRSTLACAGACLAGPLLPSGFAFAQDAGSSGGSVAATIASSIARGIASQINSYAMGQIMTAIGINGASNASIASELSEVLTMLATIENQLNDIETYLKAKLNELEYAVVYGRIDSVVATNGKLSDLYRQLVGASDPKTVAYLRKQIQNLINDPSYQTAPQKWNQVLTGVGSTTGLLKLWGEATYAKYGNIYGSAAAQAMQTCWDFFDAQQLLTYSYLIDAVNDKLRKPNDISRGLVSQWFTNRQKQLLLVRGGSRTMDLITDPLANVPVQTRLRSALRDHTVFSKSTGRNWCTKLYGPITVRQLDTGNDPAALPWLMGIAGDAGTYTQPHYFLPPKEGYDPNEVGPWLGLPNSDTLRALLTDCGVNVDSGSIDLAGPLRANGFEVPPDFRRLVIGVDGSLGDQTLGVYLKQAYNQGGGVDDLGWDDQFYAVISHAPWSASAFYVD